MKPNERIVSLYEDNAAQWDAQRGRELFERPWLDRFLALLRPGGRVLDIGCGMGEPIAGYLLSRGAAVTGLDASPSLIARCRERFPAQDWIVGDMRAMDLGGRFDGLLAWHSFFHLAPADQRPMFARFAAHAAPGAALMFTSGTTEGEAIGAWQGEPLYHGSLDTADYRALLAANGFEVLEHAVSDPTCGHATIWLARYSSQP
jgi:SAM-dependent methyltransferase